ncbi:MAG: hypothetical protein HZA50_03780 [Planctomycetes bacterium]|nr:hypothetical protein [Planctomycetota bacterium]
MQKRNKILIISGPHANESCSPIFADKTYEKLLELDVSVEIIRIPHAYTLLANLDDPQNSIPDYCIPRVPGMLDMDLEGFTGDGIIRQKYPESLVFEFHCGKGLYARIAPDKPIRDYRIGEFYKHGMFVQDFKYEIAWWRNISAGGTPGKTLIEMPVVQKTVNQDRIDMRMRRLEELAKKGYTIQEGAIDAYFKHEADIAETARRGLLGEEMINKLAAWMAGIAGEGEK